MAVWREVCTEASMHTFPVDKMLTFPVNTQVYNSHSFQPAPAFKENRARERGSLGHGLRLNGETH